MKSKLLIVEDDSDVLELLNRTFQKTGEFEITTAREGTAALHIARTERPDVLLLDLMLPGMTGLEVCRILKADAITRFLPIVMVTAKTDDFDRINGFELGADDYVTKPFSPREVVLRVKAILRRRQTPVVTEDRLKAGSIVIDRDRRAATVDGRALKLTTTEFKLLSALVESCGRVLGRGRLLTEVWGYEGAFNTRTVDTHVRRLREKLGKSGDQIQTVRGFGYRIKEWTPRADR